MSKYSVAALLFEGADVLDFTGPIEVFSLVLSKPDLDSPRVFSITTFGKTPIITASTNTLKYQVDKSFEDVKKELQEFDILLVPGGPPTVMTNLITSNYGKDILELINTFVALPPRENRQRILLSVCTGAWVLGAAGVLKGRTATTHHMCYDGLKALDQSVTVAKKRWVDVGTSEAGVGIVTAGGVSSGMDAALYVVEKLTSKESAGFAAELLEFERRGENYVEAW
ncbi:class I glutamine amidotransferase-like protein [Zopfia rhizophila CBS 207.26]|uniref:Class I glutamine amidotransferase-like protein n=1 Tax=Zopfia rhizophila CBS 207.26 TaxID=1314779 RepID=A0A6A6E0Q4_9PEZI|nr:class I glutamine amidotransferase-like protein [Zopfia rhizophila CBS 207.26]